MTPILFFAKNWFRSELLSALGLPAEDDGRCSGPTFNELRIMLAKKLFGIQYVESVEFRRAWLECEIATYERCIAQDTHNYNCQTKVQKRRSSLPESIRENQAAVAEFRKQLAQL